jgi:hypothetical protein
MDIQKIKRLEIIRTRVLTKLEEIKKELQPVEDMIREGYMDNIKERIYKLGINNGKTCVLDLIVPRQYMGSSHSVKELIVYADNGEIAFSNVHNHILPLKLLTIEDLEELECDLKAIRKLACDTESANN